jgi:CheY-like chemotaxis protein
VLIVGANRDLANILRAFLERRACTVVVALDGSTALGLAGAQCPDLVLLDLELPRGGASVAAELLALPERPADIVAVTEHAESDERAKASDAGVSMFLRKPIDYEQLDSFLVSLRKRCA